MQIGDLYPVNYYEINRHKTLPTSENCFSDPMKIRPTDSPFSGRKLVLHIDGDSLVNLKFIK